MASDALLARLGGYPTGAVLSHLEDDGFPASVRVAVRWVPGTRDVVLVNVPPHADGWCGGATLLFHRHDERLEGLAQLLLKGAVEVRGGDTVFVVTDVVTANGRSDTDEMPHAGAPLHMIQFLRVGRGAAKAYLRKRGAPWPPIPYDAIARAVAEEAPEA
jgi:hypothetical protein